MYIKTIQFNYKRKINIAKYESADIEASAWADIEPEEDPNKALTNLGIFIRQNLRAQAAPILAAKKDGTGPDLEEAIQDIATLTNNIQVMERKNEETLYKLMLIYREFAEKGIDQELLKEFEIQFPGTFTISDPKELNYSIDRMAAYLKGEADAIAEPEGGIEE